MLILFKEYNSNKVFITTSAQLGLATGLIQSCQQTRNSSLDSSPDPVTLNTEWRSVTVAVSILPNQDTGSKYIQEIEWRQKVLSRATASQSNYSRFSSDTVPAT